MLIIIVSYYILIVKFVKMKLCL